MQLKIDHLTHNFAASTVEAAINTAYDLVPCKKNRNRTSSSIRDSATNEAIYESRKQLMNVQFYTIRIFDWSTEKQKKKRKN